jgi:hypothetical protein
MHHSLRLAVPALASLTSLTFGACGGDDPVQYSEPLTISLKAKSSDVANGTIEDDKGVTTETSNPYGAFVTNARAALGGKDPSSISVDSTKLTLGAASTGVLGLGQVFTGNIEVNFTTNDTNNTYPAAWGPIVAADGSGPLELTSGFDSTHLSATDFGKLLGGTFKVGLRGPAAATFAGANADADLQVTLTFTAFE